ncbi:MAG TPA: MerR family transcriptional regulator [Polyangiaceae bacterium]|jgi:DNA-binding transcriptional MerR regulator
MTGAAALRVAGSWPYKMRDLCRITGMPRQAIHFYIQQGLVPPGRKTGRNTAHYGEQHVERIRLVRQLQNERFMPLKAIRAVLDGKDDAFTPAQRGMLLDVKQRLSSSLAQPRVKAASLDARALLARHDLDRDDLDDLVGAGVLEVTAGPRGKLLVAADDAWVIELYAEVRRAGFTRDLGFDARLLRIYERSVAALFEREKKILTRRLAKLPPDRVAPMLEKAIPLVHQFFARYHSKKVRDFFARMGD